MRGRTMWAALVTQPGIALVTGTTLSGTNKDILRLIVSISLHVLIKVSHILILPWVLFCTYGIQLDCWKEYRNGPLR